MIALAGIVVRNSIILIDFIHHGLAEGKDLEEAIIDSGAVRFTPILLYRGGCHLRFMGHNARSGLFRACLVVYLRDLCLDRLYLGGGPHYVSSDLSTESSVEAAIALRALKRLSVALKESFCPFGRSLLLEVRDSPEWFQDLNGAAVKILD